MLTTKVDRRKDVKDLTENAESNITMIQGAFSMYDNRVRELIGDYKNCWLGYSKNGNIRHNAASGGIVSSLLIHALRTNTVDKVLVSRLKGMEMDVVMSNDETTIYSAQGSIYSDGSPIGNIVTIKDNKCAVVALPCQIKHLRDDDSPLIIGLFCGHTIMKQGMEFLFSYLGIRQIDSIQYRAKVGEQSGLLINGSFFSPASKYFKQFFNFFYVPSKCLKCKDQTAEYSDISCGDAWLKGYKDTSIFIARTDRGKKLIESAIEAGLIEADITTGENVIKSQRKTLYIKKGRNDFGTRVYRLLRKVGCFISSRPRLHFIMRWYLRGIGI